METPEINNAKILSELGVSQTRLTKLGTNENVKAKAAETKQLKQDEDSADTSGLESIKDIVKSSKVNSARADKIAALKEALAQGFDYNAKDIVYSSAGDHLIEILNS